MRNDDRRTLYIDGMAVIFWVQEIAREGRQTPFGVSGLVALIGKRLIVLEEPAEKASAWHYSETELAGLIGGTVTPVPERGWGERTA